jgi:hypothetical protein
LKKKNLVAVVKFLRNSNSPVKLSILVPQLEKIDEDDGSQLLPLGFVLFNII